MTSRNWIAAALVLLTSTAVAVAAAPTVSWVRTFGDPSGLEQTRAVEPTPDGGAILLGGIGASIVLTKLDSVGAIAWDIRFDGVGPSSRIAVTPDGGAIVATNLSGIGAGGSDLWIVRLDPAGSVLWQKAYGTPLAESAIGIAPAPGGGWVIAGNMTEAFQPSTWLLRIDDLGGIVSQNRYFLGEAPIALAVTSGGDALLAGTSEYPDDYINPDNTWVVKVAGDGTVLWRNRYFLGNSNDVAADLVATADGGAVVLTWTPSLDAMSLLRLSPAGAVNWRNQYGPLRAIAESLVSTSDGGYAMLGTQLGEQRLTAVVTVDAQGAIDWQRAYGLSSEQGRSLREAAGVFWLGGITDSMAPFVRRPDRWVVRLDSSGAGAAPCRVDHPLAVSERAWPLVPYPLGSPAATATTAIVTDTSLVLRPNISLNEECSQADLDPDGDGARNDRDNCPIDSNPGQADTDGDGIGDACDGCAGPGGDPDGDGACSGVDNCLAPFNPDQLDVDGDGYGDSCDPCALDPRNDIDGDGVCANLDNCPTITNPDQADSDGDGIGDACRDCSRFGGDQDEDGVCTDVDNCAGVFNPDQADSDGDGIGDACSSTDDLDHDGVLDFEDACPNSILDPTVVVPPSVPGSTPPGTALPCDSGVPNALIPPSTAFPSAGCTISDTIAACDAASPTSGGFQKCVKSRTRQLRMQGVLTEKQRKAIDKCAKKYKKRSVRAATGSTGGGADEL